MQTRAEIRAILASRGLAPRKSLGQNFLVEHAHLTKLIEHANFKPGDAILEVGPGTGTLTDELIGRGANVVACELDAGLAQHLRDRYATHADQFTLIEGDALAGTGELRPDALKALSVIAPTFKLVANLPYNIASPLMVDLAIRHTNCNGQYVTIQREVAQRLRASVGTKDYFELTMLINAWCSVRRIATLPPGCFWPPPSITSEMIAIEPRPEPPSASAADVQQLCRMLFTKRRKTLRAILGADWPLPDDVDPSLRPERLTTDQALRMATLARRAHRL